MSRYKKKKHSRFLSSPGKPKKNHVASHSIEKDIEMTSTAKKTSNSRSNMKVVKGRKLEKKLCKRICNIINCSALFCVDFDSGMLP